MSLTKGEAYALYIFLATDSDLTRRLTHSKLETKQAFWERVGAELTMLRRHMLPSTESPEIDDDLLKDTELQNGIMDLYGNYDGKITNFDASPSLLRENLMSGYSGGACPSPEEQLRMWSSLKKEFDSDPKPIQSNFDSADPYDERRGK